MTPGHVRHDSGTAAAGTETLYDPYANAFNDGPTGAGHRDRTGQSGTGQSAWVWERKYEIDSLAYPVQLAYDLWQATGRTDHLGRFADVGRALDAVLHEPELIGRAVRTATTALRELAPDGVVGREGGGGDEGLFKGVLYRYLGTLLDRIGTGSPDAAPLLDFVRTSTDRLWETGRRDGHLLAGDDWRKPAEPPVFYSTQLSAIMALELRAAVETRG